MDSPELRRIKSEFLASLNHEVRTPLSGILGMADLLMETRLDEQQREYVSAARLCAMELLQELNSALEFSAVAAGQLELETTEFNLPELLSGVPEHYQAQARAKGLRLFTTFEPGLPELAAGDPARLREIVWHLVGNAIKFTRRGEVEVRASAAPAGEGEFRLTVAVRDTGIGMSAEQLRSLFDPLSPRNAGLARRYPGLGLGMALSAGLIRLMGGAMTPESKPGEGSVVSFWVPLRVSREPAVLSAPASDEKRRVLVVDDYPASGWLAAYALEQNGYEAEVALSGEQALATAVGGRFDLVLMDLQMPGMDGFEATRALRGLPGYTDVPVIALTAHTEGDYRAATTQEGMQGYLTKPLEREEMLKLVGCMLGRV